MSISLADGPLEVETEAASKVDRELEFCSRSGEGGSDKGDNDCPAPTVSPIDSPSDRDIPDEVGISFFEGFAPPRLRAFEARLSPASPSFTGLDVLRSNSTMSAPRGRATGLVAASGGSELGDNPGRKSGR